MDEALDWILKGTGGYHFLEKFMHILFYSHCLKLVGIIQYVRYVNDYIYHIAGNINTD